MVRKSDVELDPTRAASASRWDRLNRSLARTRDRLAAGLGDLILGERSIDQAVIDEVETSLLAADVGVDATERVVSALKDRVSRRQLGDAEALKAALTTELVALLDPLAVTFAVGAPRPYVVLVVGVNGAGKTTLIGKLAKRLGDDGHSVVLAAGDTFRAAAVEQLGDWGRRNGVPVIAQGQGADSASVIYDAIDAAMARGTDVVLADTAGRLQAKVGLMDELAKIKRVMGRFGHGAPHEVLLVLDAGIGQNALSQVTEFDRAVGVTALAVTKLDGTAKAGVVIAIAAATGLPLRFVGVGEGVDDLQDFDAASFVDALLGDLA
ncbi:MAG: signal recognition particle-docking protein FtsY [Pseudomonadales bacterium]|nr:signal recognition particle-docking protein FtsY [Pseudomonadales bacterium]